MSPPTASLPALKAKLEPAQLEALTVLLARITAGFKALAATPVQIDEAALKEDFRSLPEPLGAFAQELSARVQFCRELQDTFGGESAGEEFLRQFEGHAELAARIALDLSETRKRIKESKGLLDGLFKITSKRGLLARIDNVPSRKHIGRSMSEISITLEKVFEAHKQLEEALRGVENCGLEKKAKLDRVSANVSAPAEISAAASPPVEGASKESKQEPPPVREELPVRPHPRQKALGAGSPGAGGSPPPHPLPPHQELISHKEFLQVRARLNEWAKWRPLAPANLGIEVTVLSAHPEPALKVEIEALWGERRRASAIPPHQGGETGRSEILSLWDLPAAPPETFQVHEESQNVPGEVEVQGCESCGGSGKIACPRCRGQGKRPCDCIQGSRACAACAGSGKTLQYQVCRTTYRPGKLEKIDYSGDLPARFLAAVTGEKTFKDSFSALAAGKAGPDLEKKCLEAAAKQVKAYFLHEVVEPFFLGGPSTRLKESAAPERRLVRARLEVTAIPVLRLQCSLRDPAIAKNYSTFSVWLYGNEQKLHIEGLPPAWSRRATAWLAGLFALAVPAGYAAARMLQLF